jgi:ketosteroid isomerase-like protein
MLGAVAGAQHANAQTPLEAMVATERAFSKMSEDQGTRPAFMEFIAEDGILFRPMAVKGKQWFAEHPLPPSAKRGPLLAWYPAVVGISRNGDMGYSTGPWEARNDGRDSKPVAWGTFLTIWKRQPDGQYRFAIDLGISNPEPAQPIAPWTIPANYKSPGTRKGIWKFSSDALLARDADLLKASTQNGIDKAFKGYASSEVRVYREGKTPFVGVKDVLSTLPKETTSWTWTPSAGDVSTSDDLGYTYGTYKLTGADRATVIESGNYFRIWRKEGGDWKILFDLLNPLAPPKN